MQDPITDEFAMPATPEQLFAAWTEGSHLMAWWGDGSEFHTTGWEADLRVGGQWRAEFTGADGSLLSAGGSYVGIDAPTRLSFTFKPDWDDDPATTIEMEFLPAAAGSTLKLRQSGFANPAAREDHRETWVATMAMLRDYLGTG